MAYVYSTTVRTCDTVYDRLMQSRRCTELYIRMVLAV